MFRTIEVYYQLTKPGIIYGNVLTTAGGFFLAAQGRVDITLLLATFLGISLVMAAGCVFNNILDRDIDRRMQRTRGRALVKGVVSIQRATLYGSALAVAGITLLGLYTNLLTLLIAAIGFVIYVLVYTPLKRKMIHSTVIGSIAGAAPPMVGYSAVNNQLDVGVLLLFLVLVSWQLPHFYAIAMYRADEYKKANIPLLPARIGLKKTKLLILFCIIIFIIITTLFTHFGLTGYIFLGVMASLGSIWFLTGAVAFKTPSLEADKAWARKMFLTSLIVITGLSVMLSIGSIVP